MTDTLRERVARAIHDGLGGNGWAYTDYAGEELVTNADELAKAADAAIALVLEEAARVAEDCSVTLNGTYEAIHIAAAIRAIKEDT